MYLCLVTPLIVLELQYRPSDSNSVTLVCIASMIFYSHYSIMGRTNHNIILQAILLTFFYAFLHFVCFPETSHINYMNLLHKYTTFL